MCFDLVLRVFVRESFIRMFAAVFGVAFTAAGFPILVLGPPSEAARSSSVAADPEKLLGSVGVLMAGSALKAPAESAAWCSTPAVPKAWKGSCHHVPCEAVAVAVDRRLLQEVRRRLEGHLEERRRARLDPRAVERRVPALVRHVVGDEPQVPLVDGDA